MRSQILSDSSRRASFAPVHPYQEETEGHDFQTQPAVTTTENAHSLFANTNQTSTVEEYGLTTPELESYEDHSLDMLPPLDELFGAEFANVDRDFP
jgi:hypothetical protein